MPLRSYSVLIVVAAHAGICGPPSRASALLGGRGKDDLDGGPGKDKPNKGEDKSSKLRHEVAERLIDWGDARGGLGLSFTPFSGTTLNKHGPNLLDYD